MNWILVGFKGCGKTYFGKELPLPHLDTDDLVEKKVGMSIKEIVQERGIDQFRAFEKQVIHSLNVKNHVISTGGGVLLDPSNASCLKQLGTLIYLKCPKELLKRRLAHDPLFFLEQEPFDTVYEHRCKLYEKNATHTILVGTRENSLILEDLWGVINSENTSRSPLGENRTEKPLVL